MLARCSHPRKVRLRDASLAQIFSLCLISLLFINYGELDRPQVSLRLLQLVNQQNEIP